MAVLGKLFSTMRASGKTANPPNPQNTRSESCSNPYDPRRPFKYDTQSGIGTKPQHLPGEYHITDGKEIELIKALQMIWTLE